MSNSVFPDKERPVLVVGAGLAGCTLAWLLEFEKIPFRIFSQSMPGESSRVAAGVWNPIAMRRVNPGWRMKECLRELKAFSSLVEQSLLTKIVHLSKIIRPFSHQEELNFWKKKVNQQPELASFIHFTDSPCTSWKLRRDFYQFPAAVIEPAGWMNVPLFIEKSKDFFSLKNVLHQEVFDYSGLRIHKNGLEYDNRKYSAIVFCEGWNIRHNPYFSRIRLEPARGEVLELIDGDNSYHLGSCIINKNIFLMEKGAGRFVCGSTFSWEDLEKPVTEEARNELLGQLDKIIVPFLRPAAQYWGVRPSTHDRRPFIGPHPEIPHMFMINGLGSKGVFLAPLMCREFVNFMLKGIPLNPELHLLRRRDS